jgi:hypothetical protein
MKRAWQDATKVYVYCLKVPSGIEIKTKEQVFDPIGKQLSNMNIY